MPYLLNRCDLMRAQFYLSHSSLLTEGNDLRRTDLSSLSLHGNVISTPQMIFYQSVAGVSCLVRYLKAKESFWRVHMQSKVSHKTSVPVTLRASVLYHFKNSVAVLGGHRFVNLSESTTEQA